VHHLDIAQITKAITDGKRMAYRVADYFRKHVPGFGRCAILATADDLGIRASRFIDGEFKFSREFKEKATRFSDSIGKGVVMKHVRKHKGKRAWSAQVLFDETFDIPYRCLLPRKVDNLLMGAGRSTSQTDPFLLRVMAITMVVGQAAGAAAALAAQSHMAPRGIDIKSLQRELRKQGANV
jgi:hypothetical protein